MRVYGKILDTVIWFDLTKTNKRNEIKPQHLKKEAWQDKRKEVHRQKIIFRLGPICQVRITKWISLSLLHYRHKWKWNVCWLMSNRDLLCSVRLFRLSVFYRHKQKLYPLKEKKRNAHYGRICVSEMLPWSVPPGRLVGEWCAEASVPCLVPLRAIPQTTWRCPAPARCHAGGKAICHRGAGRPCIGDLHPWLRALQTTSECQVWILWI